MEHELKRNMYCVPKGEYEHQAVVLIGRATGALVCGMAPYQKGHAIVYHEWGTMSAHLLKPSGAWYLTCADFIAAMYAMAEKRKASPPPEPQAGSIRYAWDETRGMWKEAPTSDQIAGLEKRIKELETNDALFRRDLNGVWVAWTTGIGWEPLNPDDYLQRVAFLDYRFEKHLDFTSNSIITPLADLERQVRNLETALDRHMINTRDGMQRIQKSIDATMRYERHAGETTSADPLKGTTAAGAGDQVTNDPLEHYFMEDCCCIMIDASKSPKNIPFEVALAYLKAGRKVRRNQPTAPWSGHLHIDERGLLCHYDKVKGKDFSATIYPDWLTATDWEVIPEP